MVHELDNVDRGILNLLQDDARNITAQEIGDKIGVSPSTVRNRIDQLEAAGVIDGYQPVLDYEAANLPLEVLFVVTAPPADRDEYVEKVLDIKGVVDVRETLTGRRNIHIQVVGTDKTDLARITDGIHELGLKVESSNILNQHRVPSFNHFHYESEFGDEDRE